MTDLSIIIVNRNTRRLISEALKSIYSTIKTLDFEIIVVDNGSIDGSCEMIRKDFPKVIVIENKINIGFPKANNMAIRKANGCFILLLNSDTVLSEDAVEKMVSFLDMHTFVGIVGPQVIGQDGSIQYTCARSFPRYFELFCDLFLINRFFNPKGFLKNTPIFHGDYRKSRYVECLSGCCMLLRRKDLETLGLLDESQLMYYEDIELCHRFTYNRLPCYYLSEARIVHLCGGSSAKIEDKDNPAFSLILTYEGYCKFFKIKYGFFGEILLRIIVILGSIFRMMVAKIGFFCLSKKYSQRANFIFIRYFNLIQWAFRPI